MELKEISEKLNAYLRPQTFPVAVRLTNSADDIPEKSKMPKRDMNIEMALCQAISLARRFGWVIAIGPEDQSCPAGALALGFYPTDDKVFDGSFEMPFWGDQPTRAKIVKNIPKMEYGTCKYIIFAPLERADFEPDLILFYGNSAQISRLVQSHTMATGGPLPSDCMGAFACAEELAGPIVGDKCQVTLPCGGERAVAHAQDDELCFSMPRSKIDAVMNGLEETHKAGTRYPIASHLVYQPNFTPGYKGLMDHLRGQGDQ